MRRRAFLRALGLGLAAGPAALKFALTATPALKPLEQIVLKPAPVEFLNFRCYETVGATISNVKGIAKATWEG